MNEADKDVVIVACECGNDFPLPRDCLMFGFEGMFCGQCGEAGKMQVVNHNPRNPDLCQCTDENGAILNKCDECPR